MFLLIVYIVVGLALAGIAIKLLLDRQNSVMEITWQEYGIGMAAVVVISLGVVYFGTGVAQKSLVTFHENWNGWEKSAVKQEIACKRDGSCWHDYDCDPYPVPVTYSCNCDDDGCSVCLRIETHYHSCPYVTVETTYEVDTTLGNYTIASHCMPASPEQTRWEFGKRRLRAIPQSVLGNACIGEPPFWTKVEGRIIAKAPGPVTARKSYDNYVLASEQTILKGYSSNVERFKSKLPPLQAVVREHYSLDRVYSIGCGTDDTREWQDRLARVNGAFGSELRGDLHVVRICDQSIASEPDAYAIALKAHWQNSKVFGRDALSKNSVVLIVGASPDGASVSWARAFTGMPIGNEHLIASLQSRLIATAFTPEAILGTIVTAEKDGKILATRVNGVVPHTLWGDENALTRFTRVSMKSEDKDDNGSGFAYLSFDIKPTLKQQLLIALLAFIAGCAVWTVFAFVGNPRRRNSFINS